MEKLMILESNRDGRGILIEGYGKDFRPTERILTESTVSKIVNESDRYKFRGIFLMGDIKNHNGRIYPFESVLRPECDRFIQEKVRFNRACGELEHPNNLNANSNNISHRIIQLYYDGANVIGEAIAGERSVGGILRDFMDMGLIFGVSSRGAGTIREAYVQNDFELCFVDAVFDPSAPKAFMKFGDYMNESLKTNRIYDDIGMNESDIEKHQKEFKSTKPVDKEKILKMWDSFLYDVKKQVKV